MPARGRVESRTTEMPGHGVPTWEQVQRRRWTRFTDTRLVIDDIDDPDQHVTAIIEWLAHTSP